MGSATTYNIAKRGQRVLGIDQFSPPHTKGSSHGDTRITRLAIGEGDQYTPLALRSHEIWRSIEQETRKDLLTVTGGLIVGDMSGNQQSHGNSNFLSQTIATAKKFGIQHEVFNADQIRKRFPQFAVEDAETGYFEHEAGFLRPETCVSTQLELAERYQAVLHKDERVLEVLPQGDQSVRINTTAGTYEAGKAVITAGPWVKDFLSPALAKNFSITRQVLFWIDAPGAMEQFTPGKFPVFIWASNRSAQPVYGFPAIDGPAGGVKIATEQFGQTTTPAAFEENVSADEKEDMRRSALQLFPALRGACVKAVACKYTTTPDFGFVIDTLPDHPQILVASPCSGHGFKHSAAIGESISQMVIDGKSKLDMSKFTFERFQ